VSDGAADARRFRFVSAIDGVDDTAEERWLVDKILPYDSFLLVIGKSKVGKTTAGLALARALLKGEPFLGLACEPYPRRILYVNADMPARRFQRWARQVDCTDTGRRPMLALHAPGRAFDVTRSTDVEELAAECRDTGVGIPIFDVWGGIFSADEDNNSAVRSATDNLRLLLSSGNLDALGLIHHAGHSEGGRARGASAMEGAVDVIWRFTDKGERSWFKSEGRLDPCGPIEVIYDEDTHRIAAGGVGVKGSLAHDKATQEARKVAEYDAAVLLAVTGAPGVGRRELQTLVGFRAHEVGKAVERLKAAGQLRVERAGSANRYYVS
jgi:DNA polymerase III delta prime subunit